MSCDIVRLCGITSRFQLLSPSTRQVTHALLTRPPLSHKELHTEIICSKCFVRLACVKHAASVHPEPGSNSHKKFFPFQNQLANFNHSSIPNVLLFFRLLWLSSLLFSRTHFNRELLRCSQWIFQGYFTVQLSKFFVRCRSATFTSYQMFNRLSTTFFIFFFVVLCDSSIILPCTRLFVNNFFHVFWLIAEKEGFEPSRRC